MFHTRNLFIRSRYVAQKFCSSSLRKGNNRTFIGSSSISFGTTKGNYRTFGSSNKQVNDTPTKNGPFIDPSFQKFLKYRKDDVIISVPAKSGTTWMMNIVHQLRSGGDPNMRDLYEEVPWLEMYEDPDQTPEELLKRWDNFPFSFRRAFKTHAAPPIIPYNQHAKYIVVFRDTKDAIASMYPFLHKHTDDMLQTFGLPIGFLRPKSLDVVYEAFKDGNLAPWDFLNSWWSLRHKKNVFMIHFNDLKRDREGSIRKIASFLDIELNNDQWKHVLDYTSFKWMKEHGEKFSLQHVAAVPLLQKDGMVRSGTIGDGKNKLTPAMREEFDKIAQEKWTSEQIKWSKNGGQLS